MPSTAPPQPPRSAVLLDVRAEQARHTLGRLTVAFVGLHLLSLAARLAGHGNTLGLARLFDMDMELSVPALFSTVLFLGNAALFVLAARAEAQQGRSAGTWRLLAFGFLVLAIDENCQLHETLNEPLASLLPSLAAHWLPSLLAQLRPLVTA